MLWLAVATLPICVLMSLTLATSTEPLLPVLPPNRIEPMPCMSVWIVPRYPLPATVDTPLTVVAVYAPSGPLGVAPPAA